jgi:hypothetical protein
MKSVAIFNRPKTELFYWASYGTTLVSQSNQSVKSV